MKWLGEGSFRFVRGQEGFTLIETIVAVAILAAIGVTFINAINTGYGSVRILNERTQAEALIRSQLDDIRASVYADNYTVAVTVPNSYSVAIAVQAIDTETCAADSNCNTLQKITVAVSRGGSGGGRAVLSVSTYKVKE
jgi:prepilin-type N-terminal cleavage/methylation domain-containing protein